MVQAIINISNHTNHILNIVKAKYDLRTKSEAIELMAEQYEEDILEPELKPEYIEKAKKIMKEKSEHVGTPDDLRKKIGLN
jgi:hypothetical protein